MSKPWVEKYRPTKLSEIVSQEGIVRALSDCVSHPAKAASLSHLLFHGPAGTGKTTAALALTRQLFGTDPDTLSSRVKELNASDDRGIQVVRGKVKKFSQSSVSGGGPLPPFKIIILDEADALLPDAQSALRRMMEDYAGTTRFILICNYVSRIIDPITSRCVKYRFRALPKDMMIKRLKTICEQEGQLMPDAEFLSHLLECSGGDLRNAITMVQSVIQYSATPVGKLTAESVSELLNVVPEDQLQSYISALFSGNFSLMRESTEKLLREGYAASRILHQLLLVLTRPESEGGRMLSDVQRSVLCIKMAEVEHRLMEGGDDFLQLLDFGATVLGS